MEMNKYFLQHLGLGILSMKKLGNGL
ncbi:hypothetical protein Patl1_11178 [Pistacia atlantica]|uniref:Uncharacterized protein n=1 Tax=Pistacia atlantica TaxID=434234 RepID=A0ACC1A871_9ROSI|nr:hypothetical protein Patl1_11178 [Pistacia atlantica]